MPAPVALDGYGADGGPELVAGGSAARRGRRDPRPDLRPELHLERRDGVELEPTTEWIGNEAEPVAAVRSTPEASVVRAAAAVAEGGCSSLVSAGSTGATMTAALFALKRAQGVHRPALAVQIPVPGADGPPLLFLDCGANTDVRPQHLIQFAFLGSAFSAAVLGVGEPPRRAALGRRGAEEGTRRRGRGARGADGDRGRSASSATSRDATCSRGEADVIVTDGFTGQRHPEDARGDREGGRRRGPRRRAVGPAGRRRRAAAPAGPRRAAPERWTRTPSAGRSCSACAASRWWPTEAPPRRGSRTRSGSPTARCASGPSSAPASSSPRRAPPATRFARSPSGTGGGR